MKWKLGDYGQSEKERERERCIYIYIHICVGIRVCPSSRRSGASEATYTHGQTKLDVVLMLTVPA